MAGHQPFITFDFRRRQWRLMVGGKFVGKGYNDQGVAADKIAPLLAKAMAAWEHDTQKIAKAAVRG